MTPPVGDAPFLFNVAGLLGGGLPRTLEGWRQRVRRVLAVSDADSNRLGLDYATWTTLYDTWIAPSAEGGWPGPTIGYAVFVHDRTAAADALQASLDGIAGQFLAAQSGGAASGPADVHPDRLGRHPLAPATHGPTEGRGLHAVQSAPVRAPQPGPAGPTTSRRLPAPRRLPE